MKRLKKDYYLLPEAEEVSQYRVDDFLSLAEKRHIALWTLAHDWQITWTDEAGSVKVTNPIEFVYGGLRTVSKTTKPAEPPIDYFYTGYVRLSSGDMPSLRVNQRVRPTKVYAEKDGQSFVGTIDVPIFDVEINDILITHEDLLRVENGEVGNWESETDVAQKTTATVGDQTIRNEHKAEITNLSVSTVEHNNIVINIPDQNDERGKRESRGDLNSREEVELEGKTALKPTDAVFDGRSARRAPTQVKHHKWQQKCDDLKKKTPKMSLRSIAYHMSGLEIADGADPETIRRIIRLPKS